MFTPYLDTDVALPRASLLSYLRHPLASPQPPPSDGSAPPPYNKCTEAHQALVATAIGADMEDEESNCGFWGERTSLHDTSIRSLGVNELVNGKYGRNHVHAFLCFWCSVSICAMAAFGIFFVIDLGCSQYGMGTGMAKWMIHEHARQSDAHYEIQLCLKMPNREVLSPQLWRYINPKTYDGCRTEVVTLLIRSGEISKLLPGAKVLMGEYMHPDNRDEEYRRSLTVEEKIRIQELGDNLAEEGKLWQ